MSRKLSVALFSALVLAVAIPMTAADGAALFQSKCAMCHGADGTASTTMGKKLGIRSFASPEVQKQTDAVLLATVKDGKGKMPAYGTKLSAAELQSLVAHIRTFAKK